MRTTQSSHNADALTPTIIESVADTTNVSPRELSTPLYNVVDPEALERVFAGESAVGEVVFNYHGCEVTVSSDGTVSVERNSA